MIFTTYALPRMDQTTRTTGLHSMRLAAKELREVKAGATGVFEKDDQYFAKIDTKEAGRCFFKKGPVRKIQQDARQGLHYIRSAAEGAVTWAERVPFYAVGCQKAPRSES